MTTEPSARMLLAVGLVCLALPLTSAERPPEPAELDREYTASVRPLLETYCFECHGGGRKKGEVQFDQLDHHLTEKNVPVWTTARNVLDVASMPPEDATRQPTREERERLLKWIAGSVRRFEADHLETQGDVLLRRINLRAYRNMVRTLTGVRPDVSDFQQDGTLQHFDTAGSAIYFTQDQLDQFFACGQKAIADAMAGRAAKAKRLDVKRVYRDYYQGSALADLAEIEKFTAAHSDAAGFATIRELPKRTERPAALKDAIAHVVEPVICATYGKKKFGEIEKDAIDWTHDDQCRQAVLSRLRQAADAFKQRIEHVSEFQPLSTWHGTGSPEYALGAKLDVAGTYTVSATLHTFKAGCPLPMKFMADGKTIESFLVDAPPEAPQTYSSVVYLDRGDHQIVVVSTLPEYKEGPLELQYYQGFLRSHFGVTSTFSFRGGHIFNDDMAHVGNGDLRPYGWRKPEGALLTISDFRAQGPLEPGAGTTPLAEALAPVQPDDASRETVERRILAFMRHAYAGAGDAAMAKPYVDAVMAHIERNKDFAKALAHGVAGVLSSPRFLYLEETQRADAGKRRLLDGRELARRLAYFLWSDLPDAELQALAAAGGLRDETTLAAQVRRLIKDPRSAAFREAFTEQWLRIDHIDSIVIPYEFFPGYDTSLFDSARRESVAFFSEILDHDLTVLDFVDSDFVVVNNRMAMLYGIPGIAGPEFRRVTLTPASHRGGVLGQASVLIATSNGMTSSLVRRGAFIMEQLLGMPPGVPPPNVPALNQVDASGPDGQPLTQSARLASHRSIASCARCHDQIDPLGIGLENYDALGAWNDQLQLLVTLKGGKDDGKQVWKPHPAEVAGKLPDGTPYDGADALRACLKQQPERFLRRLTENLMIYALGRDLQQSDGPALDAICARTAKAGYGLATLIENLVLSDQFRNK